jgi:Tetratricopeptide repeat
MKLSTLCAIALCCLIFAVAACGQTQTVNVDTFRQAGAAYYKAGKYTQAVKAFEQVIRMSPNDADAYSHLGDSYTKLNRNSEAAAAYEKSADLLMAGTAATVVTPAPPANPPAPARAPAQNTPAQKAPAQAPPVAVAGANNCGHQYCVGQRVEYGVGGKWYKAIITEIASAADIADQGPYHVYLVHSLGFTQSGAWVGDFTDARAQLRAPGSGATEPVPGGEANDEMLKAMRGESSLGGPIGMGKYVCTTNADKMLARVGGFTLLAGGAYTDESNVRGTFGYDPKSGRINFNGAGMNGQKGTYDSGRKLFTVQSGNNWVDCGPGN